MRPLFLLVAVCALLINSGSAQNWSQMNKVVSNERAINDQFGFSVRLSGNYAIIGSHLEDEDENGGNSLSDAGAAYIFKREECSWVFQQKIVASDRGAGEQFGLQVSIEGDYAFIGSYLEDEDQNGANPLTDAGAVYIFKNMNGIWTQIQKIVAPVRAAEDFFGYAFSVHADHLVIGAYREDEDENESNFILSSGSVYVYKNISGVWSFQQKLVSNDRGPLNYFGFTVDIMDNTIMIGAYNDDKDENGLNPIVSAGSAYFFNFNGTNWTQSQKVTSYERSFRNWFGYSIKLSGDFAFVGVHREAEDENGANTKLFAGAAYVLQFNGTNWVHHQKLVAPDRAAEDFFGNNLAVSGNHLLISAYREEEDSIGLNTLPDAGSAYLFNNISGNWQFSQKICPADRGKGDFFSLRLDIEGDYILLSSSLDDEDVSGENTLNNSGSAYFFRNLDGSPCDAYDACLAIDALIQSIHSSSIPAGTKTSLTSKLHSAKSSFKNGQNNAAINKLNAFINEVQAQSGKKIPVDLAILWIESAQDIIDAINSGEALCNENNEELQSIKNRLIPFAETEDAVMEIYPNPASHQLEIHSKISEPAEIYLTDLNGKIIYYTLISGKDQNSVILDIDALKLNGGYYNLTFLSNHQIVNQKIVITK